MASPNTTFVTGAIYTATQANNLAWGCVGSATLAVTQAVTTVADLTGMSITFTAVADRRYLLSLTASFTTDTTAEAGIFITNSANAAQAEILETVVSGKFATSTQNVIVSPAAGSITFKIRASNSSGSLTVFGTDARAPIACRFIAQDIGAA